MFAQFAANGLVAGCVTALVAVGFALVYRATRVFHVAHGAVFSISSFSLYFLHRHAGLPLSVAILGAIALAGIAGLAVSALVYGPLIRRSASEGVMFVSSTGVYTAVVGCIAILAGNESRSLSTEPSPAVVHDIVVVTRLQAFEVVVSAVACACALVLLRWTRWGHIVHALADDGRLLSVLGVDERRVRGVVFVAASVLCGMAACMVTTDVGANPQAGMDMFLLAVVATIVGGIDAPAGAMVASLLLGVVQSFVVWGTSSKWANASVFAVLVVVLLVRPRGLFAFQRRAEGG